MSANVTQGYISTCTFNYFIQVCMS